ncbi:MAG: hypothetical protein ThorAB25_20860 [Candidatus Thorarchaeota archaeon AB_25]|nr:MAG: hypothetical protein ThorAB25_20860 [Candidatus Thorarchaeota archaeon AB_25]
MQWKKVLFATIVGIILFIADIKSGFIAFSLGGIPSIFLIVFIVGILAGDISGGFVAGLLTELLGTGLLAVIPQILIPEFTFTETEILFRMWIIMAISVSYSTTYGTEPVPWLVGIVLVALLVLLAPFVFGFALIFGPLGGLIGRFIYPRIFKSEPAPTRVPAQQPQPSAPPPPQEEPMKDTSFPEEEPAPQEEPEDDPSEPDLDTSE